MSVVHVSVAMRVRDVAAAIDQRYRSRQRLQAHIRKHPDDMTAVLLEDTMQRHEDAPDMVVELGETILGEPEAILAASKLELIGNLLGKGDIGIRELARRLDKSPATVLEQVTKLEKAGLVKKESKGPGRPAKIRPLIQEITIRVRAGKAEG